MQTQTVRPAPGGEEPPLFSRAQLQRMLWPLLLEQLLAVTMGVADTAMVSSVGEAAVSGVSLVDGINVLILQVLSALAAGGAVVTSQYLGRKDTANARRSAAQLYLLILVSTTAAAVLVLVFHGAILSAVFGALEPEVMAFSRTYFFISAISYPFMGVYNAGAALFRAMGNSRISMYASLVMNLVNVAGNALLIFGFGMGVLGAALATLLGRVLAAVWVTAQMLRAENPLRLTAWAELRPQPEMIRRMLALGVPSGVENGMFQIGKLLVIRLIGRLGTAAIAANAVCNTISTLANIPGNAVALAMIPVVGQCLGAGQTRQARRYAGRLMGVAYLGVASVNLVLLAAAPWVIGLFRLSPAAMAESLRVLRLFNLVSMVVWPASFVLPNALRAGGDARYTMAVSMLSMWAFRVALCYLFVLRFELGLMGVWYAMSVDWAFRALMFALRFFSGKWIHRVI